MGIGYGSGVAEVVGRLGVEEEAVSDDYIACFGFDLSESVAFCNHVEGSLLVVR